ncbi:MAG: cyclic nucleotide-binding domain-containing protein [Rhodocyclaceae bacterium]|nr:cyclic nucleotide-binding domain-containing protein [Rhodocyclaceae bacterium]MDZ4215591.1 cyclic nucleotide-binding domain-containing protein [Rhodocyclaceae bacterium]
MNRSFLGKVFAPRKLTPQLANLAKISLFNQLSATELGIVDGLLHHRDYLADEVVFDEGEEGQAIYLIESGQIVLMHPGQSERIATLGPGSFFGDMALIDNAHRTAQARAMQGSRLAVFFREDFLGLMDTHARIASKIALQMAREMGRRLRQQQSAESPSWHQHQ